MRYLWHLFYHFFSSNSRHGTHSPFVYRLANEVIYAASDNQSSGSKQEKLLSDIGDYFEVGYSCSVSDVGMEKAFVVDDDMIDAEQLATLVRQFRYLVIPDIYKVYSRMECWKAICRDPRFIVCIDLFYYGLVFYRREQPKELFKLRFPYWRRFRKPR